MPYEQPTVGKFNRRFPEFDSVDDVLVDIVLGESISAVGSSWLERDRALAQMLHCAHTLAMEGEPGRSQALIDGDAVLNAQAGAVTEMQDRDARIKFSERVDSSEETKSGPITQEYKKTTYGTRFLDLQRKNFAGARVV